MSRPLVIGVDACELQGRPTGTGRYLRNLLRAWTGAGRDRVVAYLNGPAPADAVLHHPAVTVREVGRSAVRGLAWQQVRLPDAAAADGLDVLLCPAYTCPLRFSRPRVTAVHDLSFFALPEAFTWLDGVRRRTLVAASVRASARVLACSDFTRREIAHHLPEAAARVRHVALGADDDLPSGPPRAAARAALGVRGPLVVTVGSILNRRRLPELLQAVALLRPRFPDLRLDVVGDDRTHPALDPPSLVARLGLEGAVHLPGFVDDAALAVRYAAADAAVFLSDYEGFGLGAVEAMARGVPVVASRDPSLGEVCAGGARLVDGRDAFAVAQALGGLLGDSRAHVEAVAAARACASRYAWADTAERTRAVLAEAALA